MIKANNVYAYTKIDFRLLRERIELPRKYVENIKRNWQEEMNAGKQYKNGKIFTMSQSKIQGDYIQIFVQETDFAHYLYSRKQDINEYSCRSMAANALLLTNDNYFVLGKMSNLTSMANRVKFIGGTIDESDFENEVINIYNCVLREVKEEIGIDLYDNNFVKEVVPIAFLTRTKLSFLNTLYLVKLNVSKDEIEKSFTRFKVYLESQLLECELSELHYVYNDYNCVSKIFHDGSITVIDYMKDFFETYYGKKIYGNIKDYIKGCL